MKQPWCCWRSIRSSLKTWQQDSNNVGYKASIMCCSTTSNNLGTIRKILDTVSITKENLNIRIKVPLRKNFNLAKANKREALLFYFSYN